MHEANRKNGNIRHSRTVGRLLFASALLGGAAPVNAQSGDAAAGWQYAFTPYFWAAGLKADMQATSLPKVSVDKSFSDIWDILDFAAMGTFEARKDRWGFLFDAIYIKLGPSGSAAQTGGPGPIGSTLTANADVKIKETILTAGVAYRVSEGRSPVDVIGGLRYVKLDVSADIGASLFGPLGGGGATTVSRTGDQDWVDPYVGVRIQHPLAERWMLDAYADVGGFGVGSDLTWQAILGASYEYSKSLSFRFGYRYMSIDYDKNGALYDATMQGPYAGVSIRF